jgi:hypothetical protein
VDESFEKLLLSKMSRRYKKHFEIDRQAWADILNEEWHRKIKKNFVLKNKEDLFHIPLNRLDRGSSVTLNADEISQVFESTVMPKILNLIDRQIESVKKHCNGKVPKVILPVGGFGRCPYVIQRLREKYDPSSLSSVSKKRKSGHQLKIEVHSEKGESPWGAVLKGACLYGRRTQKGDPLVKSRRVRHSVGFFHNDYGSPEDGAKWMADFDTHMIPWVMKWLVKKVRHMLRIRSLGTSST